MNDETINRAIDIVAAGAGKVEQAVIDMAPHVWGAEVAYWRVQGIMALLVLPLTAAAVAILYRVGKRNPVKSSFDINPWFVAATVVGGLGGLLGSVVVMGHGAAAFAPEMYAIRDLLEIVK